MPKPVFVLLHGAWHLPRCWNKIIPLLGQHGYEAVAPHLPSSGYSPPSPDWNADIDVIRTTVSDLAKERDIVVVMHSNSGMTGGTALEGLDKKACTKKGWKGGVIRLIYICAFIVPEGFQHSATGTRDNMVEEMKVDFDAGVITVLPEDVKGLMYQDVSDEEALEVAKTLVPQSLGGFWCTTTYAAWRYIPTTYVVTLKDKPSTVVAAEYLVKTAMEIEPNCVEKVIRREVGHAPFWSQAEWTVEMLAEEARGKM
ncbi:Alpha/Beta hydrolase protein [Clohesyomyces aquaticus]|uniref:Alpha/Beta hydrolase protein n=1 Tax=Clohesyomyces aquaticus TaxID=1231657 RepID=A0A1Y1ZAG0_9PLEO|nr:Alpha/Beta hydrolase protein [Clohesyomyces aquaticus]